MAPNKRKDGLKHVNFWIPVELDDALVEQAQRLGLSRTDALVAAAEDWLRRQKKQPD